MNRNLNRYLEMKKKHQKEFNDFPCFFAFNAKQFNKGMKKLGLTKDDGDQVYKGVGGMIYKRTDSKQLRDMMENQKKEHEEAVKSDLTGNKYIFQMFRYELNNHEYSYTGDPEDSLDACGVTYAEVQIEGPLKTGFDNACIHCMAESC